MDMNVSRRALLGGVSALGLAGCAGMAPSASASADALGDSDGVGLAARIRAREITANEALEAAIARAERIQPRINFMATAAYEYGRARASANPQGPLGGVPTLIKDLMNVTGVATMFGSRAYRAHVAASQTPYMDSILAGGLVPFGKTTTPEFGFTATTEPLLTGNTRNPWNPEHSSGGSSGGAAAAVAAGVAPLAHASDGGGSIRIPASCCGLVGLKPSRRRYAQSGDENEPHSISVNGCVSRTVRDTAAWMAVTERTISPVYPPIGMVTGASTRRLRIGLAIPSALGAAPHGEVAAATESAAELCRRLGHTVRETRMNFDGPAFNDAFTLYWASGAAQTVAQIARENPGVALDTLVEPLTLYLTRAYQAAPNGALQNALRVLAETEARYSEMFADMDVLLTPTLARAPARLGEFAPTNPDAFAQIATYVAYTPLQNAAGAPSISLPLAMSSDNLPIGLMFSAAKGDDRTLIELAYELEAAQPWIGRHAPIWAG